MLGCTSSAFREGHVCQSLHALLNAKSECLEGDVQLQLMLE